MTYQKRDEMKDAGILWDTDEFESDHEVEPWRTLEHDTRFVRYVPHSDLVAAEAKTEKLREALDMLLDEVNAAPLAVHGGKRDIDRFELALKVAREFANEGRP